jgi:hypothetical protein
LGSLDSAFLGSGHGALRSVILLSTIVEVGQAIEATGCTSDITDVIARRRRRRRSPCHPSGSDERGDGSVV